MNQNLKKILRVFRYININTLRFNFKYFIFKDAILFPVFVSSNTYLRHLKGEIQIEKGELEPGMIRIGYGDVGIFDKKNSRAIWETGGTVIFKGEANIGHGSKIVVGKSGRLIFGERFSISAESAIICFCEIEFGNDCLLSWDVLIMDTDFHKIYSLGTVDQINLDKKITVGDDCWIGCRSLILKGAILPRNTIVAGNSYVGNRRNPDFYPDCIVGGMPAQLLKKNVFWKR